LAGSSNQSGVEELQQQHSILRNSIEQLKMSESLRATLIHHLKEALNEQVGIGEANGFVMSILFVKWIFQWLQ